MTLINPRRHLETLAAPYALRRARGDAAFFIAAPPEYQARFESADFDVQRIPGGLVLSPSAAYLTAFELANAPIDAFSASVERLRGQFPCEDALKLFAAGLRLLECSDAHERRTYDRRARQLAAVCLRQGLGGAYACALIRGMLPPIP